jgi:polysaccharide chain length determinant protein (PEP-CTERM system associated)
MAAAALNGRSSTTRAQGGTMEQQTSALTQYLQIIKRRKWSLILPAAAIVAAATATAFLMAPIYCSEATIHIEEQEIPSDFVASTETSSIEQRIRTIHQRVMHYDSLVEVIRRHDPYPEMREKGTMDEMVARMQSATTVEPVSAPVVDRRTGRSSTATVAFVLKFTGRDPLLVQRIAQVLAGLFLEENQKTRVRQVEDTSAFLEGETARIKNELVLVESKISAFKQQNIDMLPELLPVNIQGLNNSERMLADAYQRLNASKEREGYLDSQLIALYPNMENESRKRLEELKVLLAGLTKTYSDYYPDVKKTRAEIDALERSLAASQAMQGQLPDNPAYITMSAQLASVRAEILSTQRMIERLTKDADEYRRRVAATPGVEDEYNDLIRSRKSMQVKYDELICKLMDSRVAQGLEKGQKGERFTMVDAPRLPLAPYKPNRGAIIFIGLVLGLGAGIGVASLREFTDDRMYEAAEIQRVAGFPVLAAIPVLVGTEDRRWRKRRRFWGLRGMIRGAI